MRQFRRVFVTMITVLTMTGINTCFAYGAANPMVMWGENGLRQMAIQEVAGYVPVRPKGVIKIPAAEIFDMYKGPRRFDKNDSNLYDYTTYIEGQGFDEARYAADYPEVAAAVGTSHQALWNHYKTTGFFEGKRGYYKMINYTTGVEYRNTRTQEEFITALWGCEDICDASMSDADKVVAVNNWICARADYDRVGFQNMALKDERGILNFGKGTCRDYSVAFETCMKILGIPSKMQTRGEHTWNIVYVNGQWLVVDVTWNDTSGNAYLLVPSHPKSGFNGM